MAARSNRVWIPVVVSVLCMLQSWAEGTPVNETSSLLQIFEGLGNRTGAVELHGWGGLCCDRTGVYHDPCGIRVEKSCPCAPLKGPWEGITCVSRNVTELRLPDQNFKGYLAPAIGTLRWLTVIDLSRNGLQPPLPNELSLLSHLEVLNLAGNPMGGPLPSIVSSLRVLHSLNLSGNGFTGAIPSGFVAFKNLTTLNLSYNNLLGPIPEGLHNLTSLKFLDLSRNSLSGSIPEDLALLPNDTIIDLSFNQLAGKIPEGLSRFQNFKAVGNAGLCSAEGAPVNGISSCLTEKHTSNSTSPPPRDRITLAPVTMVIVGVAIGIVTFLSLALCLFCWMRIRRSPDLSLAPVLGPGARTPTKRPRGMKIGRFGRPYRDGDSGVMSSGTQGGSFTPDHTGKVTPRSDDEHALSLDNTRGVVLTWLSPGRSGSDIRKGPASIGRAVASSLSNMVSHSTSNTTSARTDEVSTVRDPFLENVDGGPDAPPSMLDKDLLPVVAVSSPVGGSMAVLADQPPPPRSRFAPPKIEEITATAAAYVRSNGSTAPPRGWVAGVWGDIQKDEETAMEDSGRATTSESHSPHYDSSGRDGDAESSPENSRGSRTASRSHPRGNRQEGDVSPPADRRQPSRRTFATSVSPLPPPPQPPDPSSLSPQATSTENRLVRGGADKPGSSPPRTHTAPPAHNVEAMGARYYGGRSPSGHTSDVSSTRRSPRRRLGLTRSVGRDVELLEEGLGSLDGRGLRASLIRPGSGDWVMSPLDWQTEKEAGGQLVTVGEENVVTVGEENGAGWEVGPLDRGVPESAGAYDRVSIYADWFSLEDLRTATFHFHKDAIIGEGGFGTVYRGHLPDGTIIAVKELIIKNVRKGDKGRLDQEFQAEIGMLSQARHRNLVRLLGCCSAGEGRFLVYEFVPNGNLEDRLHGEAASQVPLSFGERLHISVGTARGLAYLHDGLERKVIHRDIKASNVLLDSQWNPRVTDFGLARILECDKTQGMTRVAGTFGYLPPEYVSTGHLTEKSDVYSFGVLLLEILTGRKPLINELIDGELTQVNLASWACQLQRANRLLECVPKDLRLLPDYRWETVMRTLTLALLCVDQEPSVRPKMVHIVRALEDILEEIEIR